MKPLQHVQGRSLGRDREMIILRKYMEKQKHELIYGLLCYQELRPSIPVPVETCVPRLVPHQPE